MSWMNEIINSFIIDEKKKRLLNGLIEGKNNFCKSLIEYYLVIKILNY